MVKIELFLAIIGMIFSKKFDYQNKLIFGTDTDTKNVPKYSTFYFRKSRYNFAKIYQNSKLLQECMALLDSLNSSICIH